MQSGLPVKFQQQNRRDIGWGQQQTPSLEALSAEVVNHTHTTALPVAVC
jgi:hypothetical protein